MNKIETLIIDFDSTILNGELLEMIAQIAFENDPQRDEKVAEICKITALGMEGKISFSDSLNRRLSLIPITQEVIDQCVEKTKVLINKDFIDNLCLFASKEIFIVSGGYKNIIDAVSDDICVTKDRIFANEFIMQNDRVTGVDTRNPLSESDGKVHIAKQILSKGTKLMIGDGMTDYYVKRDGGADMFVAYTGITARPAVIEKADFQIKSFSELSKIEGF